MNTARTVAAVSLMLALGLPTAGAAIEPGAMPAVQNYDGVQYVSGGIGVGERNAMHAAARNYDLHLTFATRKRGAYLADVDVTVHDAKGRTILQATSEGPWLYAKLPPGEYRVTAVMNGEKRVHSTRIGPGHLRQVIFRWNVPVGGVRG